MELRRVVVTGLGTVNPLANDVANTWEAIRAGKSGIAPITLFDTEEYAANYAGEVKDWDAGVYMDRKEARKMARFTQFGVVAADQALADAGLDKGGADPERVGVIMGNGIGGYEVTEEGIRSLVEKGVRGVSPMVVPKLIINEGPGHVAIKYGFLGPCYAVVTACASATDATGNAFKAIRMGQIDVAVSGGMEAAITPFGMAGFIKLTALSTRYSDNPEKASRPFDKDRDGFVMAEGAGILVLEELQHALDRGAKIYGEIAGFGMTCDAYHLTAPDTEGKGLARAIKTALKDAGMEATDLDYINAHGTSTPTNDPVETEAFRKALGDHAYKVPISSTKSMTGHMVGGAGGIEAIISLLAMRDGFVPPTINLDEPDEACDLDYVPNVGRKADLNVVMSDNLGFGGHNGALIFRKYR